MIVKINHYSMANPASVYDEEALTALELAGRTAGKVNECVDKFNTLEKDTNEHLAKQDREIPVKVENAVQDHIDNGEFDHAIDEYAGELTNRVNNIVASAGDGNTEIVDIRLGADAKTYSTAGEAVRAQIVELSEGMRKENLIDFTKLTAGFVQATGEIYPSHESGTFQRWEYTSDFIPVESGKPYNLTIKHDQEREGWYAFSTYDASKRFIDRARTYNYTSNVLQRKFTFPTDVAFVRLSYRSYMTASVAFEQSSYSAKPEPIVPKNNLMDNYPLQFDGYIVENGSIFPQTTAGYIEGAPALLEKYTRHIPVKAGEYYTVYHSAEKYAWGAVCVYDSDGNAIRRLTISENKNTFSIPEGGVSMMVCARTYYLKDFAIFKETTPMSAEQRAFEISSANNIPSTAIRFETVKSVNHRGYNTGAPENTLKAFKMSAEKGFKYVECDVRFTSDGVPVLLHDETVDRTSNGSGTIASMTFEQARALDFGQGQRIPSFVEFIALCKALGLHAYVELKTSDSSALNKVIYAIRANGMQEHVTIISFDVNTLKAVQELDGKVRLGLVMNGLDDVRKMELRQLKNGDNEVFADIAFSNVNDDVVTYLINNNIPLEVWTVNNVSKIEGMNPYITGVTSDYVHAGDVLSDGGFIGTMTPQKSVETATFTLIANGEKEYTFESGMTWSEFVESSYNTDGKFFIDTVDNNVRYTLFDDGSNYWVVDESYTSQKPNDVILAQVYQTD